jgi:hypothetical protein
MWHSSGICGRRQQITVTLTKKLGADLIPGTLATIQPRIFCLPVSCLKYTSPVVLYGCETWSLNLKEERIVRFELLKAVKVWIVVFWFVTRVVL